ncbi:NADPH:quinone oxidoreductase family protein [Citricoccus sp. K5]|uniref:NADPH:quinone oxidoreductase family protein n=1 Tax=Citricoccus sp. K5 TaxID=2653135 RepID=UPI0012F19474|nr:NADPH:quinone oxidoreductase family protein [Citricoccus sp. K5]VXA90344.1 NADPH-quinone reductase [Citricoccus sp. K5]
MRALQVPATTGPEAAVLAEVPDPDGAHPWAGGERLLVEVHSAAVAFPDVLQSRGAYQHAAPVPYVAGGEFAGIVLEAPAGSRFAVGDRVAGLTVFGSAADQVTAIPGYTVRIPSTMSFNEGAAFFLNYLTAWFTLHRAGFTDGESVLVHGAAGGVGSAALDLLKVRSDHLLAVVSSDSKAHVATRCGATEVLRSGDDWPGRARAATGGHGVDIVIDPVGGDRFTDSLRSLDVGGRLMVVGFAGGGIPEVKVNRLLLRDLSVMGVAVNPWLERHPGFGERMLNELEAMAASGTVSPLVGHVLPWDRAPEAMGIIDRREAHGKVVIEVRPEHTASPEGEHP